jgi:glycerophosphoryl diester phosphodiesterase
VVFHDYGLERMTGAEGKLSDRALHDLRALRLKGADEGIPTLAEVLVEVGDRAMVHIELKTPFGEVGPLEKRVSEVLLDHNGPTCIIGFNPYSHAWFADHHPQILRGLDSYQWADDGARHLSPEIRKSMANLEQHAALGPGRGVSRRGHADRRLDCAHRQGSRTAPHARRQRDLRRLRGLTSTVMARLVRATHERGGRRASFDTPLRGCSG